jgi:hypothetical protein
LFGLRVNAQKTLKYDKRTEIKELITDSTHYKYAISKNYITNRDYITYILWKIEVYGLDYPSTIIDAFPGYEKVTNEDYDVVNEYYNCDTALLYLIGKSDWYVKDYMFNPRYMDYPVIGMSKKQASKFNRWLSDRYNEYLLIRKNFYHRNLHQVDEDNFVTDSYLADQYYGHRKRDSIIKWEDEVLLNNFRLPTKKESFEKAVVLEKQKSRMKCLKYLGDSLFKVKKEGLLLKLKYPSISESANLLVRNDRVEIELGKLKISELYLSNTKEDYINAFKVCNYALKLESFFKDEEGYNESKDSIGAMNYLIIGRNASDEMILIEQDGFSKMSNKLLKDEPTLKVFRYAVTLKHIK